MQHIYVYVYIDILVYIDKTSILCSIESVLYRKIVKFHCVVLSSCEKLMIDPVGGRCIHEKW